MKCVCIQNRKKSKNTFVLLNTKANPSIFFYQKSSQKNVKVSKGRKKHTKLQIKLSTDVKLYDKITKTTKYRKSSKYTLFNMNMNMAIDGDRLCSLRFLSRIFFLIQTKWLFFLLNISSIMTNSSLRIKNIENWGAFINIDFLSTIWNKWKGREHYGINVGKWYLIDG